LDVCRAIRAESDAPIVIVTAKDGEADKVAGLELGADDYVTKPFSVRELVSRVRAHLRRVEMSGTSSGSTGVLRAGSVELDPDRHEVRVQGNLINMPPKEFALLMLLLRLKGRLVTRDHLIGEIWGADYFGDTKTLDVHVKRLRQKIEVDPHRPTHLLTVRGLGYRFVE
jgi:two-component system response regulator RegX3